MNDYKKQSQFRKLNAVVENASVIAIRFGEKTAVLVNDVVVGDVLTLSVGDIICADGIVLEGHEVEMDESSLTGETKNIKKDQFKNPFLLSGTKCMSGSGRFLVVAVGENSESGQIRMIVQGNKKKAVVPVPEADSPGPDGGATAAPESHKAKAESDAAAAKKAKEIAEAEARELSEALRAKTKAAAGVEEPLEDEA